MSAIPAGYKQTEVGVIPEDWDVREIGDLNPFVTSGSRGWAKYYSDRGSAFLRITNLSRNSIYVDLSDLKLVELSADDREGLRTQLEDGDLLVSITADIGIIGYIDSAVPKPAYINQHIALVRLDPASVDSKFLSYYLASEVPQRAYKAATDQGAKAGMSLGGVRKIKGVFPPLAEQRAIAAALSDVDALLAKLDQLIAKKRDLKQAAMQQLLTGQTRLPGFSGAWEVKRLRDVSPLQRGFDLLTTGLRQGSYPVVYSNGVLNYHDEFMVKGPGVVTGRSGTIGNVHFVDEDFWPHNTSLWVTDFKGNSPRFIFYLLGNLNLGKLGTGSGVPTLNRNDVHEYKIRMPQAFAEQTAIATVLSDIDTEITALEARRDKTRALKQGMMQELLTGRTRLV